MTAQPRGTSNGNVSGNAASRRRRKAWLLQTAAADVDVLTLDEVVELCEAITLDVGGEVTFPAHLERPREGEQEWWAVPRGLGRPATRCYRCGRLLVFTTITVDRIIPGDKGGKYVRNNIRPACGSCNSITGNEVRWAKERAKKGRRARSAERARARRAAAA